MWKKKPEIIVTVKTYVDGVLAAETAKVIKDDFGFWSYAVPALIGIATYWQIIAWG